jgi:p-hydroxybenzoate 3-monooxygenase
MAIRSSRHLLEYAAPAGWPIGDSPSGMLLTEHLGQANIQVILLEACSRGHVYSRVRAGLLEQGTVDVLREADLAARVDAIAVR